MKKLLFLLLPIFLFAYQDTIRQKALDQGLAKDPEWHRLLHYKTTIFGLRSDIDDKKFFLATDGYKNPQSELLATIDSFFTIGFDNNSSLDTKCIFQARYRWLKKELDIDESKLDFAPCEGFDHWFNNVKGTSVVLVFPASYMNNPASAFGHTFLRIDKEERNPLTNYALNYSAYAEGDGAIVYTIKGIFGGYPGYFSVLPYAEKTKEYADMENRDMWEYELDFSEQEIERMLYHAWELSYFYRDYEFFKKNCSFILLDLMEYTRPSLTMTDNFGLWATPIDTIRELISQNGMLKGVKFRPSKNKEVLHLLEFADQQVQKLAIDLAQELITSDQIAESLPDQDDQILAFDIALAYSNFLYDSGKIDKEVYRKRYYNLLIARSKVGKRNKELPAITPPIRPDFGHKISRIAIGGGTNDGKATANLQIRPSYHDQIDPLNGYDLGAGIVFFDLHLEQEKDLKIKDFTLLKIDSIAPRDRFFKPISWRVLVDYRNELDSKISRIKTSGGLAWQNSFFAYYLFADIGFEAFHSFRENELRGGFSAGLISRNFGKLRFGTDISRDFELLDHHGKKDEIRLQSSLAISRDFALRANYKYIEKMGENAYEATLFVDYFF